MEHKAPDPQFRVPNISDKFGDVARTKNMNFDLQGYAQLSPRMVRLYSEVEDNDFALPLAIGRTAIGEMQIETGDSNFGATINTNSISVAQDTGTNEPTLTLDSDGCFFQGLWHASTATAVLSRPVTGGASQAWTSRITGLTSGVRHILRLNKSRVQLCVANGSVVKQYNTSYANTTDLTISTDYEISGMEYNSGYMGIITRLSNDGTRGQDQEAMFFHWNGASTEANNAVGIGSDAGIAVVPYKSSFIIITRDGELKYFNGSGFQTLAVFPFYFTKHIFGDAQDNNALGSLFAIVDGDNILINIGNDLSIISRNKERYLKEQAAGVWCYDPSVGLYHKFSVSNSPVYMYEVTSGNVNTSTNVLTISSGTVPATGNIARLINTVGIGGLTQNEDYYLIKASSTTFKLAETRGKALLGIAIDITSVAGDSYFLMLSHVDYGVSRFSFPGAIRLIGDVGNNYGIYSDIVAGARVNDVAGSDIDMLSICVPWLENVGVYETAKYYSEVTESGSHHLRIRFKPLNDVSSIVVYGRTEDALNLPVSTCDDGATWLGSNTLSTTHDLSDAETYFENGALLMEILSGAGAGNIVPVSNITCENGVCSLELESDVFGVTSGNVCDFMLMNYKQEYTITSSDNQDGYVDVALDAPASKFAQYMLVPIGYDITIEEVFYKNTPHK